jgi:4a-hydroxytetrahydrobiopterin dehydratase
MITAFDRGASGPNRLGSLYFGAGAHKAHANREAKMSETSKERVYSEAEIAARLEKELPKWRYENGWIRRKYKTHSWKGTLMVINTVGHLAEAAWHHPDIAASYAFVEVKLQNHAAKGITDKDFELAKKIDEVVLWQPAKEGGALEGTPPTDQRFAYIKYD